ncbi:transcription factor bHLH144-like [Primulina huaijiensis]|uniref:transcription factor bHLH144-like n=1 Tax=Primulina huaijiensis TaxID=1492673 RepID=UPI003CC71794
MHSDQPYFHLAGQVGYFVQNAHMAPAFNSRIMPVPSGIEPLRPFHGVDIQPSEACPRNFVIFDKSNARSQIIFHPEIRSKFFDFGLADGASILKNEDNRKDANYEGKFFSLLKDDSDDIDALLNMEDVENEECDDDEVSTARTNAVYERDSPDSCSNYESPPRKRSVFRTSSLIRFNHKKRERMRTMVKVLRRMVPEAKRMSTVTVLDEAVRYLKSLKAQVHNLETGNSKTHAQS